MDNPKVLHSKFSRGWVIGGTHPELNIGSSNMTTSALTIAKICRVDIRPEFKLTSDPEFQLSF